MLQREGCLLNRIAVIRSQFLPISETFIYNETRKLQRYQAYVFCRKRINKAQTPFEHVLIDPQNRRLERMLKHGFIQLIHARFGPAGIRMLPHKLKWKVPLITSFHGCDSPGSRRMKPHRKKLPQLFSLGDCFTVPCQAMKEELIRYGCPEEKVVVQYSGIDVNRFAFKERQFPEDGAVRILYVGRLVEKKGADVLLHAFKQVHGQHPKARLVIVGDGRWKRKLKTLAKRLGLSSCVTFTGALAPGKVAEQLEKAHLFCLPSRSDKTGNREGIPNALKEAMSCGLPVVSTQHSGIPELVEDGVSGFLVPENDAAALAERLLYVMQHPEIWSRLGRNGRAKIERDFDQAKQIAKLERLFDQVIRLHKAQEEKKRERPFFSVIIPTYNRAKYVRRAIQSVLNQTFTDYEIIVVDDGSTDRTKQVVASFGNQVRYIYQKNRGPSHARNTGIRAARGEYIAFLDSDDRFLPDKLMKNKMFLEQRPDCRFLYSWYYDIRGKRKKLDRSGGQMADINQFRYHLYKRSFTVRTSTVVIHRSCFERAGLFNPKYRYSQDWDMWLRLAAHYMGYCQHSALVLYRRHERKTIPSRWRHKKIRKTAKKLFRWDRRTLRLLSRQFGASRRGMKRKLKRYVRQLRRTRRRRKA